MARRPSKHLRPARPLASGHTAAESRADGRWLVRSVAGSTAAKTYRCPGCDRVITPGTPHLVVWPELARLGSTSAVDERRHWHTACWRRRR